MSHIDIMADRTRRTFPHRPAVATGHPTTTARLMAITAKSWQVKTCLQCGAKVAVNPDGNIPEGGLPCGH